MTRRLALAAIAVMTVGTAASPASSVAPPLVGAGFSRPVVLPVVGAGFSRPGVLPVVGAGFSRPGVLPVVGAGFSRPEAAGSAQTANPAQSPAALVQHYCVTCHNDRAKTGGLSLQNLDVAEPHTDAEAWEKAIRKLRAGLMPPAGAPRPARSELDSLRLTLESSIDRAAMASLDPGSTPLHRLNRTEYGNAIRDLLALEIDAATLLPADDSAEGFDNIADVLGTSPALIERYIGAASKISRLAIGDTSMGPVSMTYKVRGDLSQDRHVEGLPLGTRGGIVVRHNFPVDGEYVFRFSLLNVNFGPRYGGAAKDEQIEMIVNGERVLLRDLPSTRYYYIGGGGRGGGGGGAGRGAAAGAARGTGDGGAGRGGDGAGRGAGDGAGRGGAEGTGRGNARGGGAAAAPNALEIRLQVKAGPQTIGVTFIKRSAAYVDDLIQRFDSTTGDLQTGVQFGYTTFPHLSGLEILGPYNITGPGETASRARIFVCQPPSPAGLRRDQAQSDQETACARRILSTLARRALRRSIVESDLVPLMAFYDEGRKTGGFERGIEMGLRRLLADPGFVFRFERDPAGPAVGASYRIDDFELASRLSFFLWSSIPDDELLMAAEKRTLRTPAVLERQVRRMLADARSQSLVSNFAGQWLFLRELRNRNPDLLVFPDFDDNLRQAFQRETELLVASVVREDRSVFDLMNADYTFVNERLARHYGIPHVYGSDFRRVAVTSDARRGLLGHGSILLVTSAPNRTSPVTRGAWILENLLGSPPPLPPPDVPAFPESQSGQGITQKASTVRERMVQHRTNPACAGCHQIMDPIGLSLENFDGIGRWRTADAGLPIDAAGQLVDGSRVDSPQALRAALLAYPDAFVQTLTEKLLMYAVGRRSHHTDMPFVRAITNRAAREDYRFSSIVMGIVNSPAFQMRVKRAEEH
jgi:cytochrome c551/c552